jgi:DNA-binding winged helix-turn-helix (wHTH) protein/predicted ATPase
MSSVRACAAFCPCGKPVFSLYFPFPLTQDSGVNLSGAALVYRFGEFSLDLDRQELRRSSEHVSVEPSVFDLLRYLILNRDRLVTKDDLIQHVWGGRIVSESTLTSRITAMRHAIGDSGQQQRFVRTIPRKGLRFVGDIYEDNGQATEALPPQSAIPLSTPTLLPNARSAERRPITILHCRIAGPISLAARLDPEDLAEVFSTYHACIRDIIARHRGVMAKYGGDEAQAYFGYLQAEEDDAERAAHAGLTIAATVGQLRSNVLAHRLQASVGIATGLVVIGEPQGSNIAAATVGEAPFVAAKLLASAAPGSVVICSSTRQLIGNLFECRRLDPDPDAGPSGEAFEVLRQGAIESRFEALDRRGNSPLVGRDEEVELLTRRWQQAAEGDGRVVLIVGEPGIGKSRLTQALRDRIASEPHTQVLFHCSPHHQSSALHPVIERLSRAAGIERDDSAEARIAKLEALLTQAGSCSAEDIAVLASLLSIPGGDRFPMPILTPQRLKERTFQALIAHMRRLADSQPLLVVFEDLHWIDPTSLELLTSWVDQAPAGLILIVTTFRPEFKPPWAIGRHVSTMLLGRLGRDESRALVTGVTKQMALPQDILEQILDRTDGIPLYIEELSKSVIESGLVRLGHDRFELAGTLNPQVIPSTLHASLLTRLDRLGNVKDIAQIGSAIGRTFSFQQIASVAGIPDIQLRQGLAALVDAELIFQRGVPPEATYLFKHALVQEAAYASMLRVRRQQLHSDIATALEQQFADIAITQPELLAYHLTEAGLSDRAIDYWLKAGQRAAERSSDQEAVRHLHRGIALLHSMPPSLERDRRELDFQIGLITPYASALGYTSNEVGAATERATILAERVGDAPRLFASLYSQYTLLYTTGQTRAALGLAQRLEKLAEDRRDPVLRMMAHRAMGVAVDQFGEFEVGRRHFEQALALHDPDRDRALAARFLTDPYASTSALLSIVLWALGYPDRARKMRDQALTYAASLNHVHTSGLVHYFAAQLALLLGETPAVLKHTAVINDLARKHGVAAWHGYVAVLEGSALGRAGKLNEGLARLREGIAINGAKSLTYHMSHYVALLAEIEARSGDVISALTRNIEAQQMSSQLEERFWEAELSRMEGELRLYLSDGTGESEACFMRALEASRKQSARMVELRASTSLARLWLDQERKPDARELLSSICNWFTEGHDVADIREARALLDQIN